jgi:type 1 fimbriae regulatory protein FimB
MNPKTIKWLAVDEVRRLLAAARKDSKRNFAILLLGYRHGLRISEVGLLRRDDVDFKAHRIRFSRLKGSLDGVHLLADDEARAIRSYIRDRKDPLPHLFLSRNEGAISADAVDELFHRYAIAAKLPKDRQHFHVLKHSIAVHMIAAGADLMIVRDWLGHKSINNTLVYAQLLNPRRDAEVQRLLRSKEIA